jgi:hypothetical protein
LRSEGKWPQWTQFGDSNLGVFLIDDSQLQARTRTNLGLQEVVWVADAAAG